MNHSLNRFYSIQGAVRSLVHSSHCRDANCRRPGCLNVKKIVAHVKQCERKINRSCAVCKQYIILCNHHAKACKETKCPVLFCLNIRHKLLQHRKQQAQIIKKRITTMQNRGMPSAVTQSNAESSYAASQLSPVVQAPAPPYPTQPGMDGNPAAGGPSQIVIKQGPSLPNLQQNSLQTLIETLKYQHTSPEQVLSILKSNPRLMADFIKQRTAQKMQQQQQQMQVQMQQKPLPQQVLGVPNLMMGMGGVNRWENANYPQSSQPHPNLQPCLVELEILLRQVHLE